MAQDKVENQSPTLLEYGVFVVAVLVSAIMMMAFFMWLPIEGTTLGIDLLMSAFDGGRLYYKEIFGLLNPPWSVLPLLPLGFLPDKAGWGLLVYSLLGVLLLSVPRTEKRWLFWLQTLILITAFPTLRIIADGQLEVLVIGGLLLLHFAYKRQQPVLMAIAVLLATAKPQSVFIVMLVLGIYILQTWPVRKWLLFGVVTVGVVGATLLWKGQEWLVAVSNFQFTNTLIDVSLSGALDRFGAPLWVFGVLWLSIFSVSLWLIFQGNRALSREKLAFLVVTSMLLAAYQGGNGILVPLAIGIITLLNRRVWFAVAMIILIDAGYSLNRGVFIPIFSYYITSVLLLMWAGLAWHLYETEIAERSTLKMETTVR